MTCSTRNAAVSVGLMVTAAGGCLKQPQSPAQVSRHPILVDEAMARRQWATVPVHYQNGETPAWPTGFVLEHSPAAPKWAPAFTDTPLFLANLFAAPAGYVVTPPWTRIIYPINVVPPTYHAMPKMPPSSP